MKWEYVKLGDIATFINGYPFKPTEWSSEGMEIIRIQNLTKGASETNYFKGTIPEKYKIVKNDILISWSATLDIFVWEGNDAWLNQHIFKVVFNKIEIERQFFIYLIKYILDDIRKQVHGATMKHITKEKFDNIQIPLPPLPVQKRIAEILAAADALQRKDQALLKKYDELAQAIFIEMFGDPVRNEKGWEVRKLGELMDSFKYGTNNKSNEDKTGTPVLRIPNIIGNSINLSDLKYSHLDAKEREVTKLREGDLLFVRSNGNPNYIGRSALFMNEGIFSYASYLIRGRLKTPNVGLANYIQFALSYKTYRPIILKKATTTAGNYNINTDSLKSLQVPVPDQYLLDSFFNSLALCNKLKSNFNLCESTSNLFQSLLHRAFQGDLVKEG